MGGVIRNWRCRCGPCGPSVGAANVGVAGAAGAGLRLCATYAAIPVSSVVSFIIVARISAASSSAASIVSLACSPVRRTSSAASCCASASELDAWLRAWRKISAACWLASAMIQSASCDDRGFPEPLAGWLRVAGVLTRPVGDVGDRVLHDRRRVEIHVPMQRQVPARGEGVRLGVRAGREIGLRGGGRSLPGRQRRCHRHRRRPMVGHRGFAGPGRELGLAASWGGRGGGRTGRRARADRDNRPGPRAAAPSRNTRPGSRPGRSSRDVRPGKRAVRTTRGTRAGRCGVHPGISAYSAWSPGG